MITIEMTLLTISRVVSKQINHFYFFYEVKKILYKPQGLSTFRGLKCIENVSITKCYGCGLHGPNILVWKTEREARSFLSVQNHQKCLWPRGSYLYYFGNQFKEQKCINLQP